MNKASASWVKALSIGLLLLTGGAAAQQQIGNGVWICDGAAQAGPCQAEGDDDSYSGISSGGYTDNDYAHAEPKWADRWGAISVDDAGAVVGVSTARADKSEATEAAIGDCRSRGGNRCNVQITYTNQCAVLVAADRVYNTYRAETAEIAKRDALKICRENGGSNCRVYYSGCSLPERIQ